MEAGFKKISFSLCTVKSANSPEPLLSFERYSKIKSSFS